MRKILPSEDDMRTIKFFAFLPVVAFSYSSKKKESRWLEWVAIRQEYCLTAKNGWGWVNRHFL